MLFSLWADLTTKSPGFSRCRRRSFEIFKRKRTSQPKKSHAGRPILLSDRDRRSPTRELAKSGSSVGKAAARIGLEVSRYTAWSAIRLCFCIEYREGQTAPAWKPRMVKLDCNGRWSTSVGRASLCQKKRNGTWTVQMACIATGTICGRTRSSSRCGRW